MTTIDSSASRRSPSRSARSQRRRPSRSRTCARPTRSTRPSRPDKTCDPPTRSTRRHRRGAAGPAVPRRPRRRRRPRRLQHPAGRVRQGPDPAHTGGSTAMGRRRHRRRRAARTHPARAGRRTARRAPPARPPDLGPLTAPLRPRPPAGSPPWSATSPRQGQAAKHACLGRAASGSRRRRLAPALVAKCRGGRQGDDPYLQEVRTPRLIRRGSEWRRRDPITPAAGSSAARARDRGPGPRRARDRWGATVDRRDGVLDDPEAATGDVRMRAHRRPLAEELVATGTRPRTRDCCRTGRRWIRPTASCRSPLMTWRPRRPKRARPRSSRCCWTGC